MKNKIYFILVSALIIVFSITLTFVLNTYYAVIGNDNFILYVTSKCFVSLALVVVMVTAFIKNDIAHFTLQYAITIGLQFVPLIVRLLSPTLYGFLISVVLVFVAVIVYLALAFTLNALSAKTCKVEKELEGTTKDLKNGTEEK